MLHIYNIKIQCLRVRALEPMTYRIISCVYNVTIIVLFRSQTLPYIGPLTSDLKQAYFAHA